ACTAAALIFSILGSFSTSGRRTLANWVGLASGILVSLGLGLFRLSNAMGIEELVIAVGLTFIEVGLITLAEWLASGIRPRYAAHEQAMAELEAAQAQQQRASYRLNELNEKIHNHLAYVEDLSRRNVNLKELIDIATKAILDGYSQGIAENRGRV